MPRAIFLFLLSLPVLFMVGCERSEESAAVAEQASVSQESADEEHAGDEAHAEETMTRPERLAFMSGHVKAGLALYRAGEPAMAAPHLLHPVSETHAAEREGLSELGFEPALFESVSAALDAGTQATAIADDLNAAEAHLEMLAARAGGDPADIIRFLMATVSEEYAIAINDGVVTDPGEYQDAYGFTEVAKGHAQQLDEAIQTDVMLALETLAAVWIGAPVPPETPVSPDVVDRRIEAVLAALP